MNKALAGLLAVIFALNGALSGGHASDSEKLIGAWQLVSIASPGPDGNVMAVGHPAGMLTYTRDGHVSVQLMYSGPEKTISNEYVLNGYEASFGSYEMDEAKHIVTHHIQGANTRDLLVGKNLARVYKFDAQGNLIIQSAQSDEHWSVTWKHY